MSSLALAPHEGNDEVAVVVDRPLMAHRPQAVLEEAAGAAKALQGVISQKPKKVVMNGEQYLEFEDWQTVAKFYGITAGEVDEPEFVRFDDVAGFKATSVARDASGRELSRATAYCLNDEEKWGSRPKYAWLYETRSGEFVEEDPGADNIVWIDNPNKPGKRMPKKERKLVGDERVPLFQLASMAQTRANAKALRNVLSWVVVLAGFRSTPAEELDTERLPQGGGAAPEREPAVDDAEGQAPPSDRSAAPADVPVSKAKPACPTCNSDRMVICNPKGEWVCSKAKGGCARVLARVAA